MGGDKMKKGLTICLVVLMILSLTTAMVSASGEDLIMNREFTVEGIGVVNIDLEVATLPGYNGVKLNERMSTPGGGFIAPSMVQYYSSFDVGIYNVTGNVSTELEYKSTSGIINSKRTIYMKNFDLGAVMGFKTQGNNEQDISMYAEDASMEVEISGDVAGKMKIFQKMVDVRDKHSLLIYDVIDLTGNYTYDWSGSIENWVYPGADEDKDYLGCP